MVNFHSIQEVAKLSQCNVGTVVTGLTNTDIYSIAINPNDSNLVYVGTGGGVFKTSSSINKTGIIDFDGDGKTDQAFYRPETGVWFVLPSGTGSYYGEYFGAAASDILVPGDYDGDGKTDYGFYRPSNGVWYIKPTGGVPSWYAVYFGGGASDIPLIYN